MKSVTIPQKLSEWAKRLGSQRALAKELGVSEPYLSDVINGRRDPGPKILKALGLERIVDYRTVKKGAS